MQRQLYAYKELFRLTDHNFQELSEDLKILYSVPPMLRDTSIRSLTEEEIKAVIRFAQRISELRNVRNAVNALFLDTPADNLQQSTAPVTTGIRNSQSREGLAASERLRRNLRPQSFTAMQCLNNESL